ncbi:MAG: hypothetical protein DRP91_02940 [Candidatus Neomarinimicrobiota bacterium]|nr:MetS family NSS transporter small subunit [Candidatus Neomarinimicrobiota bacterium]MCD6099691.1 MetS family NSS transporter small subunit [Candidatus Neomarinimicrobiota bacterium]RKY49036.1 MAG: hypothetical protein DRP88_00740 [Candidatus Neomarinimicrobiota bacterium]RKY49969.1 MAG: hypothetical protein DRP91_02940 [Candidatus Neomarinimicrobiota bacterium]HDN58987.1 MetS family NSS transporter small subunit [Candidatus Neomarinimicrobiota bacterium]
MSLKAILFMMLFLGLYWGGFVAFLCYANKFRKE